MRTSESIKELSVALHRASGKFEVATFDAVNPHFKSKYATLTSVVNAVIPGLFANGLFLNHGMVKTETGYVMVTRVSHVSGEWMENETPILLSKNDMQGLGSAITYARRYGMAALLGIVSDDDDDGNAASQPPRQQNNWQKPVPDAIVKKVDAFANFKQTSVNNVVNTSQRATVSNPTKKD